MHGTLLELTLVVPIRPRVVGSGSEVMVLNIGYRIVVVGQSDPWTDASSHTVTQGADLNWEYRSGVQTTVSLNQTLRKQYDQHCFPEGMHEVGPTRGMTLIPG